MLVAGPAVRRGVHPDGLGAELVPGGPAAPPPLHDLRQEAALHRGVPVLRRGHAPRAHRRPRPADHAGGQHPQGAPITGYVIVGSAKHSRRRPGAASPGPGRCAPRAGAGAGPGAGPARRSRYQTAARRALAYGLGSSHDEPLAEPASADPGQLHARQRAHCGRLRAGVHSDDAGPPRPAGRPPRPAAGRPARSVPPQPRPEPRPEPAGAGRPAPVGRLGRERPEPAREPALPVEPAAEPAESAGQSAGRLRCGAQGGGRPAHGGRAGEPVRRAGEALVGRRVPPAAGPGGGDGGRRGRRQAPVAARRRW